MTASLIPISVVIPARNAAANLDECLSRLKRFAEIVVVDSSSVDATPDIARRHGARLINFSWNGQYPKKRNWLLLNHDLRHDWVLFLDSDEYVDDAFIDAAHHAVLSGQHAGYWLNYTNHFLGRPLRHGIPQRKLALFDTKRGLYERIDEQAWSGLDMEVHEHPIIEGDVGHVLAPIDHRDTQSILRLVDRHREYAAWESHRTSALRRQGSVAWSALTPRQRFKYANIDRWWYAYLYFLGQYFGRLGILDGHAGLQYAQFKFWYFSTIRLLCLERAVSTMREEELDASHAPAPLTPSIAEAVE